jgi:hypothetical protein
VSLPIVQSIVSPPTDAGALRTRGTVVPALSCPRCSRRINGIDAEQLRTMLECYRRECRQRWWAMALECGLVEPQLVAVFSESLAPDLMRDWSLPMYLDRPAFWQIKTSRNQSVEYERGGSRRLLEHFRALFSRNALGVSARPD